MSYLAYRLYAPKNSEEYKQLDIMARLNRQEFFKGLKCGFFVTSIIIPFLIVDDAQAKNLDELNEYEKLKNKMESHNKRPVKKYLSQAKIFFSNSSANIDIKSVVFGVGTQRFFMVMFGFTFAIISTYAVYSLIVQHVPKLLITQKMVNEILNSESYLEEQHDFDIIRYMTFLE